VCARPSEGPFVEIDGLPVHVGVLWHSAEAGAGAPRGPMHMHVCAGCGYVWNAAFDPGLLDYEQEYDNALHGSALFRRFEAAMVEHLVERYGLRGRTVVEVGCGDGRFLGLLAEAGGNDGVGFEPGYRPERRAEGVPDRVEVLAEPYRADHPRRAGDLLATRQVLEHVDDPVGFLAMLRRGIGERGTALYVDVPNGAELLDHFACWDLMYEHCGVYVEPALRHVAEAAGFAVTDVRPAHSGQFLVLEAQPGPGDGTGTAPPAPLPPAEEVAPWVARATEFGTAFRRRVDGWRERLAGYREQGLTVVAWGAGGRGSTFFSTVGIGAEVAAIVDLNPAKQGTFLAGTGHAIVAPGRLADLRPDVVIVVNRVYADEVRADVERLGLSPKVEVA
jgi:SAM-dependent methyltransferase